MQCPRCHADVGAGAGECPACGAALSERVESGPVKAGVVRTATDEAPPPDKRSRRVLLVSACVLALVAVGVAAALVLRDAGDEVSTSDAPPGPETGAGSVEPSASDEASATAPKTETPIEDAKPGDEVPQETPAPLGYPTAEAAARASLEANDSPEYVLAPAREDAQLVVYWAGPPQSEWVYEIIVRRLADGSWSVVSMTNIWEDYEVP